MKDETGNVKLKGTTSFPPSGFKFQPCGLAVVLLQAALALFLFLFLLLALFDFAAALTVLEANGIAKLVVELLQRRHIECLQTW